MLLSALKGHRLKGTVQGCYLIYKQFEPNTLSVHFPLLFGVPALLVYQFGSQLGLLQQIGTVLSYWGLILAFTAIYRLSPFHPLAKYPGPTLAKLSKVYWCYLTMRDHPFRVAKHWHDKCGDVVRIGKYTFGCDVTIRLTRI